MTNIGLATCVPAAGRSGGRADNAIYQHSRLCCGTRHPSKSAGLRTLDPPQVRRRDPGRPSYGRTRINDMRYRMSIFTFLTVSTVNPCHVTL